MSSLLYTITTLTLTTSAPTTLFPVPSNNSFIPITGATGFQLCTKLNLAGCGTNTINTLTRTYVNNEIQSLGYNYSLPLDPCDFDTINMTWILSLADLALLSLITADQVINEMPCELYIQMPNDFLSDRGISDITTDSYWFGANGQCIYNESNILDCSNPNRTIINYTEPIQKCFYPFVSSNYKTPINELYEAGYEHCGISCDYIPYTGDINKLDNFNYASATIALIFGICFFVNVVFEVRKAYNGKTKFSELPLTFDIPIMISIWIFILTMIFGIAAWTGKKYFACEIGTNAMVENVKRDNTNCYIAGQFTMLALSSIYFYCSLLAFAIWRSLANPFKPLFGFHKIYYHIALNIVVLGYYIGAMAEDIFAGNTVTGICGPNVTGDKGIKYLLVPLIFDIVTFTIFTILSIYKLWIHFQNQQKRSPAEKAIVHLAIRMVIYSVFIAVSLICFLYMSARFVGDGDEWADSIELNIKCFVQNELFGGNNECKLDLPVEDDVYWMQGVVSLLITVASFVLSCSNQRYTDYSKMRKKARKTTASTLNKIKSIGSVNKTNSGESSNKFGKKKKNKLSSQDNEHSAVISVVSDTRTHVVAGNNDATAIELTSNENNDIEMETTVNGSNYEVEMINIDDQVENVNNDNNTEMYL